ncbi:hypothetical protein ACHAW5_001818 [Stephanodiscus triporus]|uniref:Uncharacterized protein n=1 Tax=Stephanodiscus triporus TaxID=2934178 RepID=A0ABD3MVW7_9STRA
MRVSSPIMIGLLAWQRVVVAAQDFLNITSAFDIVYVAFYSDSSCSQFAGISATYPNDDSPIKYTIARKDSNGNEISCTDAMACLYMPDGQDCQAFGELDTAFLNQTIDADGNMNVCDSSNPDVGLLECEVVPFSSCIESSLYNCHHKVFTQDMLKDDPTAFIPPGSGNDTTGLKNYAFMAYYDDDDCTNMVGMRGFVADNPWGMRANVTTEGIPVDCETSMACFLNENGTICESMDSTMNPVAGLMEIDDDGGVYLCRAILGDSEPSCSVIEPDECVPSTFYPSCQFHWLSAESFAKDPASLVNPQHQETDDTPKPPVDVAADEASQPSDTQSAACLLYIHLWSSTLLAGSVMWLSTF